MIRSTKGENYILQNIQSEFPFEGEIIHGDAVATLKTFPKESVNLSFWSPPYHVGKKYEVGQSFEDW